MRIKNLIKRDGIICGLCKMPVNLTVEMPHPLSATIGHIIPVARGGNDLPDNLRVEHWECNMRKSSYLDGELDLSTLMPPNPIVDFVSCLIATEKQREGGCRGGHRTKELHPEVARLSGLSPKSLAALEKARTPEHQREASSKGGWALMHKNNPSKARELGLQYGHLSQELGRHNRWHVARHQFNSDCSLCQAKLNLRLDFFGAEEQKQCSA